jgi:hypothetical protein
MKALGMTLLGFVIGCAAGSACSKTGSDGKTVSKERYDEVRKQSWFWMGKWGQAIEREGEGK